MQKSFEIAIEIYRNQMYSIIAAMDEQLRRVLRTYLMLEYQTVLLCSWRQNYCSRVFELILPICLFIWKRSVYTDASLYKRHYQNSGEVCLCEQWSP